MSRRRNRDQNDSLDLLLDTITNTFGGILLLALLLALLVQRDSSDADDRKAAVSPTEVAQLQQQVGMLRNQKQIALTTIQSQAALDLQFSDAGAKERIAKMIGLAQAFEQKKQLVKQQTARKSELDQQRAALQDQVESYAVNTENLRGEIDDTREELQGEKAKRTRNANLPREQVTGKNSAVLMITNSRFYVVDANYGQTSFALNRRDFQPENGSDYAIRFADGKKASFNETGGLALNRENLLGELKKFDAQDIYLTLVVLPDAFEQFYLVRDSCVSLGLEHFILPINALPIIESYGANRSSAQ
jgi:hypothetical protein